MMRLRYFRQTEDMTEEKFRRWAIGRIAALFDIVLALIVGMILGVIILNSILGSRADRQEEIDGKLLNLACLALHYTPPDTQFHRDLAAQYPNCPKYHPAPGLPKRSISSTSLPPPPSQNHTRISHPSHHTIISHPSPSATSATSPVTAPNRPVVTRTVTRTHTVSPGHPVTRTRTYTVTPPPPNRPTPTHGPLCSPLHLPVGLLC
jgi:hypothetical protein